MSPSSIDAVITSQRVPLAVRRLAVWYPPTSEQEMLYGYSQLEHATFQLKTLRSWIKIVAAALAVGFALLLLRLVAG